MLQGKRLKAQGKGFGQNFKKYLRAPCAVSRALKMKPLDTFIVQSTSNRKHA
jgi:hypothetical protein